MPKTAEVESFNVGFAARPVAPAADDPYGLAGYGHPPFTRPEPMRFGRPEQRVEVLYAEGEGPNKEAVGFVVTDYGTGKLHIVKLKTD